MVFVKAAPLYSGYEAQEEACRAEGDWIMRQNVLITGGTGFIGQHLLFELLPYYLLGEWRGEIYLLVRRKAGRDAARYVKYLLHGEWGPAALQSFTPEQTMRHIRIVEGDLRDRDLKDKLRGHIDLLTPLQVFHSGGSVNLYTSKSAEQEVEEHNWQGTQNIVYALQGYACKFMMISTAFSCGIRQGTVKDSFALLPEAEHYRNPYEQAKRRMEKWLLAYGEAHAIEMQIARPSVVIGRLLERPLYFTSKFDVIYGWGKFIWAMKRRGADAPIRIAVNSHSALNLIPVDYAAKAFVRFSRTAKRELNVVHSRSVPHLSYLSEIVRQVEYRGCEWVEAIPAELRPLEKMYYRSAGNVFTPYVIHPHTEYDTAGLRELMADVPEPVIEPALQELIAFAVAREFDEELIYGAAAASQGGERDVN